MIGGTFEYLMSSMPNLSFLNTEESRESILGLLLKYSGNTSEELSPAAILDNEAKKYLPASAFDIFQKFNLKNIHEEEFQKSKSRVLSAFSKFTFDLKNEIKQLRTNEKGNEKKTLQSSVVKLISEGTPLEKEIQIMKYQWSKLEELSVGHFSDMEALFSYKIKLIILLRWWSFNAEKGFENFIQTTTNN